MAFYMDILNFIFSSKTSGELKIILMIHFTLTAVGGMGCVSPLSYVFYNSAIIFMLLWSIYDKENLEPLRLMVGFEFCAVLIDLFYFSVTLSELDRSYTTLKESISAAMIFLQCLIRPFVALHLLKTKNHQEHANFDEDDEPDQSSFVERGEGSIQINGSNEYTLVPPKKMTSIKDRRQSIENNPFENDYAELS